MLSNKFNLITKNSLMPSFKFMRLNYFSEEYITPKFKTNLNLNDLEIAKKQIFWRIRNIGQLELEFLIMKWYNNQNLSLIELKQFSEEVLEMENPEMNKYFMFFEPPSESLVFTKKIQEFLLQ